METVDSKLAKFTLHPPDEAGFDGRKVTVGSKVWRALRALRGVGSLPITEFVQAVWGDAFDAPGMRRNALWSLCHRANAKLKELGCPARVGLDHGEVILF